jgi:hypothetical protein
MMYKPFHLSKIKINVFSLDLPNALVSASYLHKSEYIYVAHFFKMGNEEGFLG